MNLLHIDSSILGEHSVSRILSAEIVVQQREQHPGLEVTYRDLVAEAPLHLMPAHIAAWRGAQPEDANLQKDVATGVKMLDELFATDVIVIGVPMYNFTIPSQLKAWVDRLLVPGRTFRYLDTGGTEALIPKGKKVIIAASSGGVYEAGSPLAFMEQQVSYLTNVFGFLEITDLTIIRAQGLAMGPTYRDAALTSAREQIAALAV